MGEPNAEQPAVEDMPDAEPTTFVNRVDLTLPAFLKDTAGPDGRATLATMTKLFAAACDALVTEESGAMLALASEILHQRKVRDVSTILAAIFWLFYSGMFGGQLAVSESEGMASVITISHANNDVTFAWEYQDKVEVAQGLWLFVCRDAEKPGQQYVCLPTVMFEAAAETCRRWAVSGDERPAV